MTLSLDDVRNKRFRMARKSGYEVLEVDEFVDEVEESFAQLIEENQNLKKQVDSLKSAVPAEADPAAQPTQGSGAKETIVVTTAKEASTAVVRLVELSTEQAERLLEEATADANRIREEANSSASQVTTDAQISAEQVESEARLNAERLEAQALSRAEQLDHEIDARRSEAFGDLQQERDELASAVNDLRQFEAEYRANLADHLRDQLESLESGNAEPAEVPELARRKEPDSAADGSAPPASEESNASPDGSDTVADGEPADGAAADDQPKSDTPRLDALLGEQR